MAFMPFLAMTAAEIRRISLFPPKIAWMACHFSPYGLGLSNLPRDLSPQSMIILDDITPLRGHDPETIHGQLLDCINTFTASGILLDFQRPGNPETSALVQHLIHTLPCPVVVSEFYATDLNCPVFLPPLPPSTPLEHHLSPWKGRDIWLEIGLSGESLTLTEDGCRITPLSGIHPGIAGFEEENLHCHYMIEENNKSARFTLWRTADDLKQLMENALALGVTDCIGLYQEFPQQ